MNDMTVYLGGAATLTMSSREIADLTGKELSNVHRDIRAMIGALVGMADGTSDGKSLDWKMTKDSMMPFLNHEQIQGVAIDWDYRGYAAEIHLTKSLTMTLVSGYSVNIRKAIVDRWLQLEAQVAIPKSFAEALRLAADLEEKKQLAEKQRDEAIATKSWIGSRREATAMAAASVAVRKARNLEIELGKAKEYVSVKHMEKLHRGMAFNWRVLKRLSEEMGLPPVDVFDQNYGTVKSYHADVWRKAYGVEIDTGRPALNS